MDTLVSAVEMAEIDRRTIHDYDISGRTLMEVAGRAVADVCMQHLGRPGHVLIVCGSGNNGGDGFVAARALVAHGCCVQVFVFANRDKISGDALLALQTLEKCGDAPIQYVSDTSKEAPFHVAVAKAALIVDALLGTGLRRDVGELIKDAIVALNGSQKPIVSVDLPSGVNADNGAVMGCAVQATQTVTFAFAKRGHYLHPGASHRGVLTVADIGVPRGVAVQMGVAGRVVRAEHGPSMWPKRAADSHKGTFGHAVLLAGSPATPGAALLALLGAMRSGAGLVSWACDASTKSHAPPQPPEVMLRLFDAKQNAGGRAEALLSQATALVIGPGMGTALAAVELMEAVLQRARIPVCLDADALNALAAHPKLWDHVGEQCVITPHPKEMARLLDSSVETIQSDRMSAAVQLAKQRGCVVVLKGANTVVADARHGTVTIVASGSPALAHGGTGDLLAGLIGGLLAQRLPVALAATLGVLLHGEAGKVAASHYGEAGVCTSDVAQALGQVIRAWNR